MTVDDLDALVKQLVVAREQRALSQRRLSVRLGLHDLVVGRWECGLDAPATENFVRWARMVGYSVVLVGPDGRPIEDRPTVLPGEAVEHFEVRRLALALKAVRVSAGFTQKALGRELCVSTQTVLCWENGWRGPRVKHLLAWADRLGCRIVLRSVGAGGAPRGVRVGGC